MSFGKRSTTNGSCQTVESVCTLLHEDDLPVVVTQRRDVAVVGPIEELLRVVKAPHLGR